MCTYQVAVNAEGRAYGCIIFREKKRIPQKEKRQYNGRIGVCWQKNAWMDKLVCMEWAKIFAAKLRGRRSLLLCDNLNAQTCEPIDAGMGATNGASV